MMRAGDYERIINYDWPNFHGRCPHWCFKFFLSCPLKIHQYTLFFSYT